MPTRIKRYEERADRLDELLARIEAEMGPEAVVERRDFVRGRVLGLFGGTRMVEIVATLEVDTGSIPATSASGAGPDAQPASAVQSEPLPLPADAPPSVAPTPPPQMPVFTTPPRIPGMIPAQRQHIDVRAEAEVIPETSRRAAANGQPALASTLPAAEPVASAPQDEQPPAATLAPPPPIPSDISELKDTITELQDTMRQLIEQQRHLLSNPPPMPPQTAPAAVDVISELEAEIALETMSAEGAVAAEQAGLGHVADPLGIDPAGALASAERGAYVRLLDWNIGPYDALELINAALSAGGDDAVQSADALLTRITHDICRGILLSGGIKLRTSPPGKVVALVGATGVGKTTTIAKLAANFAFQQGKRVSLISLDNYRIAAAEQLRTYTDIMGIDLDIVFSRDEFDQVLTSRRQNDLVLIDTAGRSPLNSKQIYELRDTFGAHPPDEVHLVIAAHTKADDIRSILENFLPLSYDYVILSKLDETRSLGGLYNIGKYAAAIAGRQLPISYFTVGQSVPEDIRTAELGFIQTWIEQGRIV